VAVRKHTRIVVSESTGFATVAAETLRDLGPIEWGDFDRRDLLRHIGEAELLWVRLRHVIDAQVMDAAPGLRWIATPTTGLNHIDLEAAENRGIRVVSLRGQIDFLSNVRATAELTLALMLALLRRIPEAVEHAHAGLWNRDLFRGLELHRRTVGIVGYGRLGRIVSRYLMALGSRVLATDCRAVEVEQGVTLLSLTELLQESHVVSLHANLTPENFGFFDRNCFDQLQVGSYFVNTARGELIDEAALLDTLRSRRLAGAALDVTTDEWGEQRERHRLVEYAKQHSNLLLTPHIGGCTVESMRQAETFLATLVAREVAESGNGRRVQPRASTDIPSMRRA
jgi:D-3-phosphoglycerate dehydrogenase